jgi:riboflavin kinase/FMN adenylyltransferase
MKILQQPEELSGAARPVVLAIGFFDGVHRGHVEVIRAARRLAEEAGGEAWVLTFDPHPARVLRPSLAPRLITTTERRLGLIAEMGVAGTVVMPFTAELARCEPDAFLARLAAACPRLAGLTTGASFTFGRGARGNPEALACFGAGRGIRTVVVPPVLRGGAPVSSSRVRQAVADGRMEEAAGLLGRWFDVAGRVVAGRRVGRELGFPTANVDTPNELMPAPGVYAVRARRNGAWEDAAAYYGRRPTFAADAHHLLEVYLLDQAPDVDLYGCTLATAFLKHLRPDGRFESMDALRDRIGRDIADARAVLAGAPPAALPPPPDGES